MVKSPNPSCYMPDPSLIEFSIIGNSVYRERNGGGWVIDSVWGGSVAALLRCNRGCFVADFWFG